MKSKNFILAAMLLAMPSTIMAQQNIQKAFDALLSDKITENKTRHVLDRDPQTGRMTALADVYDFTISTSSALERLSDVRKAFDKDKHAAYQVNSATRDRGGEDAETESFASLFESFGLTPVTLYVGDGKHQSVAIGSMKNSDYIYACFADKDDPDHRYRYAYAVEWVENAKKTKVRLAVTYALRPTARVGKAKKRNKISRVIVNGKEITTDQTTSDSGDDIIHLQGIKINGKDVDIDGIRDIIEEDINSGSNRINIDSLLANRGKTPESWLSEFNAYKRLFLKNPDGATATHYATSIYSLCKKSAMLESDEKKLVISELTKLKEKTTDELIQNVFDMSIKKLKE
jgi:hypothetical protein